MPSENTYFPPPEPGRWENTSAAEAGWNPTGLEEFARYCESEDTHQLLVVHGGRILLERYYQGAAWDSTMDVASLQKAFVGLMLRQLAGAGRLSIDDPVSRWLGRGWSRASSPEEDRILLHHLTSMTSGLYDDFTVEAEPGSIWYYNNNAYHQLRKVIETATADSTDRAFVDLIAKPLGMGPSHWQRRPTMTDPHGWPLAGLHANARDVARLGLCILARGRWHKDVQIDEQLLDRMLQPSQGLNPSYGHLWWLPTQPWAIRPGGGMADPRKAFGGYRLNGPIIHTAPDDLVAGMGSGEKRLYVSASLNVVVVRLGPAASHALGDSFDEELWRRLLTAADSRP